MYSKPGIYVTTKGGQKTHCMDCHEEMPPGTLFVVNQAGAVICSLHEKEFNNGILGAACMIAVLEGREEQTMFKPALIEECKSLLWLWDEDYVQPWPA